MRRAPIVLVAVLLLAGITAPPPLLGLGGAAGGEDPGIRTARALVPHNDESVEVRMAYQLWGDHQDLLRQNQRIIDAVSEESRGLVRALGALGVAPVRKVGIRSDLVKKIGALRGGQLERTFMRLMIERNASAMAILSEAMRAGVNGEWRPLFERSLARRRAENAQYGSWLRQWYP